jgi:HEPN domain-containing protein
MNAPPETWNLVRQWIEKAEHDLRTAEHTLKLKKNCPFDTVCFHAQQCAEKYLKALLVARGIVFPKTHDLRAIIQLAPAEIELGLEMDVLFTLTQYAVDARYPEEEEPITRQEAKQAVAVARQVREAVRANLPHEVWE